MKNLKNITINLLAFVLFVGLGSVDARHKPRQLRQMVRTVRVTFMRKMGKRGKVRGYCFARVMLLKRNQSGQKSVLARTISRKYAKHRMK
ncbi:MAG TPA: hypothetical protein VJ201_02310 [Candidatus Babeliales bacterium]|nr:hypothetical protein [Candidatus Babeliales bacterium]